MSGRYLLLPLLGATAILLAGCPDKKPKDPTCDSDKDCEEGQLCINKKCVECGKDSDCPDGETCEKGACVSSEDAECTSDDDCGEGEVCKDGECQGCESNSECGPGGKCVKGECERPKKCDVDEDCADDEDCIDGRCQQPWKGDITDDAPCNLEIVYFDYDQFSIREDQRDLLSTLADCMAKAEGEPGIYIVGHADENGTEEYNIALSERRARAVADYLARLGVDPARFRIVPKGESEPSGRGEDADRRVEFEWR